MITADAGMRGGRVVPYKHLVDEACRLARFPPSTVVIVDRPKESLFQKVKVQCAVNFQDVEEVMVVLSRPSVPFRAGID